jgi:hypothetical protein
MTLSAGKAESSLRLSGKLIAELASQVVEHRRHRALHDEELHRVAVRRTHQSRPKQHRDPISGQPQQPGGQQPPGQIRRHRVTAPPPQTQPLEGQGGRHPPGLTRELLVMISANPGHQRAESAFEIAQGQQPVQLLQSDRG